MTSHQGTRPDKATHRMHLVCQGRLEMSPALRYTALEGVNTTPILSVGPVYILLANVVCIKWSNVIVYYVINNYQLLISVFFPMLAYRLKCT